MPKRFRVSVPETHYRVYEVPAVNKTDATYRLLDALNGLMENKDVEDAILQSAIESDCVVADERANWSVRAMGKNERL